MNELTKAVLFRVFIVGIYLLMGAGIFEALEKQEHHHTQNSKKINDIYFLILEQIWNNLSHSLINDSHVLPLRKRFNDTLLHLREENSDSSSSVTGWTFYSALYFSSSVVTTIGK